MEARLVEDITYKFFPPEVQSQLDFSLQEQSNMVFIDTAGSGWEILNKLYSPEKLSPLRKNQFFSPKLCETRYILYKYDDIGKIT